jgi:phosphate starvation-inducible PhoH-like protein
LQQAIGYWNTDLYDKRLARRVWRAIFGGNQLLTTGQKGNQETPLNGAVVEKVLAYENEAVLRSLLGERNENLKFLEKEIGIRVGQDGQSLVVSGLDADVELASDLLNQIADLLSEGENLFPGDFENALRLLSRDRKTRLKDLFRDQIVISGRKKKIVPKTPGQKAYLEAIRARTLVFGVGPAGTGKTYLAMAMAVAALLNKDVRRIILCRPAVEAGEKLGFLPGDMAEKVNPYLRPLYDALYDMVEPPKAAELIEKGVIEVAPLAFMRGRTLANAFIILDEAQNTTREQMKMFLTRLGFGSKCVVTGDLTQVDLPRGKESGLRQAIRLLSDTEDVSVLNFNDRDVIRHPLVSAIVRTYESEEKELSSMYDKRRADQGVGS